MSFRRFIPKRASTRAVKRTLVIQSSGEERTSDFQYDNVKDEITAVEDGLDQLRKKLKSTKKAKEKDRSRNFETARQHLLRNVHGHLNSLNTGFNVEFEEISSLKAEVRQYEDQNRIDKKEKSDRERKIRELQSVIKERENAIQDKESKLRITENEIKKQQSEYETRFQESKRSFSEQLQDKEDKFKRLELTKTTLQDEIKTNKNAITRLELTITTLQDEIKTKENAIASMKQGQEKSNAYQEKLQKKENEISNLKETKEKEKQMIMDHYNEAVQNKEKEIHKLNSNLQHVNHQVQQYAEQKEEEMKRMQVDLQRKENTIQQLLKQRDEEKTAKEDERKQKDEALTRLSAIAGDRLRNNNPGITDLSDPNRPMKIAEKFTEMYDNDWTDSMEALEDLGLKEEECVIMLLHFLTDSYEECGKLVAELDRHIEQAVTLTHCEQDEDKSGESSSSSQSIPPEILKPIKDIRRKMTVNNMEILQKKLLDHLKKVRMDVKDDHISACSKFVADCIKYAWMMQIQDPPVYIEWDFPSDTKIDTNILRSYTKAGDHVDFIVWPVLYLHKDGPVLNKGVVQPKSK